MVGRASGREFFLYDLNASLTAASLDAAGNWAKGGSVLFRRVLRQLKFPATKINFQQEDVAAALAI
jgi:hypothetical protein